MRALLYCLMLFPLAIQAVELTAELEWTPPTTRVDGSTISDGEIGGYRVYSGKTPESLSFLVDIPSESTTYTANIVDGKIYFAVTAYSIYGAESDFSEVASKAVPKLSAPILLTRASN